MNVYIRFVDGSDISKVVEDAVVLNNRLILRNPPREAWDEMNIPLRNIGYWTVEK